MVGYLIVCTLPLLRAQKSTLVDSLEPFQLCDGAFDNVRNCATLRLEPWMLHYHNFGYWLGKALGMYLLPITIPTVIRNESSISFHPISTGGNATHLWSFAGAIFRLAFNCCVSMKLITNSQNI